MISTFASDFLLGSLSAACLVRAWAYARRARRSEYAADKAAQKARYHARKAEIFCRSAEIAREETVGRLVDQELAAAIAPETREAVFRSLGAPATEVGA